MTTENQKHPTLIEPARKLVQGGLSPHEEQMELARKEEASDRRHLDADHYVPTLPFGTPVKTTQAAIEQEGRAFQGAKRMRAKAAIERERMRAKKEELSKAQAAIEQERMRAKKEELSKAQDVNRFINPPGYGDQVVAFCIPDGHPYAPLAKVLEMAFKQSSEGKGKVRHASGGAPFVQQPIMTIGRMVGPGYQAGQAQKKLQEAMGMIERGEFDAAFAEALGTIVYAAALAVLISELKGAKG